MRILSIMTIYLIVLWFEGMLEHHWDFDFTVNLNNNWGVFIWFSVGLALALIQDIKEIIKKS